MTTRIAEDERRGLSSDVFPRLPAKFVGRRDELEWLYNSLRESVRTNRSLRLFLEGRAGSGKSRLIHEFLGLVEPERKGVQVIRMRLSQGNRHAGNGLLSELAKELWPTGEDTPLEVANIEKELGEMDLGRERGARVAQVLQTLGIAAEANEGTSEMPQEFSVSSTFALYGKLLQRRSTGSPLFLFLDGAQWLESNSQEALQYLLAELEAAPALILLTSRTPLSKGLEAMQFEARTLHPLSESEGLKLCWGLLQGVEGVDETLTSTLLGRSGNVPGMLEDLVTVLVQRRIVIRTTKGGFKCLPGRLDDASLPGTFGESSEARMDALQTRQRQILEMASIFGDRFWASGVERLMRHEEKSGRDAWWDDNPCAMRFRQVALDLQARSILIFETNSSIPGYAEFRFLRDSDRKHLLDSLPVLKKALYSRIAGRWLLSVLGNDGNGVAHEDAARLLTEGGVFREAGEAWMRAGNAAWRSHALSRAIHSYAKSRESFGQEFTNEGCEVLGYSIRCHLSMGDVTGALRECSELIGLSAIDGLESRAISGLVMRASVLRLMGDYSGAGENLDTAMDLWSRDAGGNKSSSFGLLHAEIRDEKGRLELELGGANSLAKSREHFEFVVGIRRQLGEARSLAAALRHVARVRFEQDDFEAAEKLFNEALALSIEAGEKAGRASGLLGLARIYLETGVLEKASSLVEEGLDIADRVGARMQSTMLLNLKGEIELMGGHFRKAELLLAEAHSAAEELGIRLVLVEILVNRTLLSFALGNDERCLQWCEEAMSLAEEIDSRPLRVLVLRARGITLAGVDRHRAISAFNRAIALLSGMGAQRQLKTIEGLKARLEA